MLTFVSVATSPKPLWFRILEKPPVFLDVLFQDPPPSFFPSFTGFSPDTSEHSLFLGKIKEILPFFPFLSRLTPPRSSASYVALFFCVGCLGFPASFSSIFVLLPNIQGPSVQSVLTLSSCFESFFFQPRASLHFGPPFAPPSSEPSQAPPFGINF